MDKLEQVYNEIFRLNIKGKTHTMGLLSKLSDDSNGILPLSLKYLFEYFNEVEDKERDNYNW